MTIYDYYPFQGPATRAEHRAMRRAKLVLERVVRHIPWPTRRLVLRSLVQLCGLKSSGLSGFPVCLRIRVW